MNARIRRLLKSAVVLGVTGVCVGGVDAAMPATAGQWSDPAKLSSSDLRQIANIIDQKSFDLTQAIRKAKRECDGTVIMAQGKLVDAQEYSQSFQSQNRYNEDKSTSDFQSGKKVVFEIACADENTMAANHIAVLPDTGDVKLVRASQAQDRFGRQVSDRDRMNQNRDYDDDRYDRDQTFRADDDDYDRDRDFAWDDWDGDGRKHEIRKSWNDDDDNYADRDRYDRDNDWSWNRDDDRGAVAMGLIRKASDVIGANVENAEGENLGEIEDLAVDSRTGQIRYAVLSFGGFLGIGDKLFAVPWTAFSKRDDNHYVLHMDKERLEQAPGFEKENWPNMANQQWGKQVDTFDNVRHYWDNDRSTTTTDRFARDDQYNRNRNTQDDRFDRNDANRGRYTQDNRRAQTNQQNRNMDDDRYTRGGEFERDRFTQSGQGSQLNSTCVRALEQHDFELTDAIQKAESETDGQAISARCQLASGTQTAGQDQSGSRNYNTEDDDSGTHYRNTSGSSKVVIEVATFMKNDTQNLRIVTISPETGEVIRTRNQSLSSTGTRSDAAIERDKLAEGN